MKYDNVKLGVIDKYKVWLARREAEKSRKWFDKIEGEVSEVDYTDSDNLQLELLKQKKMKKAISDAKRKYKKSRLKSQIDENKFIEQYLEDNGIIQPHKTDFKTNHLRNSESVKESQKKFSYKSSQLIPEVYYKTESNVYKVPFEFSNWCLNSQNSKSENVVPLVMIKDGIYLIQDNAIKLEDKYNMLKKIIDTSLNEIGQSLPGSSHNIDFTNMCNKVLYECSIAQSLKERDKLEEAVLNLKKVVDEVLRYNEELSKGNSQSIKR